MDSGPVPGEITDAHARFLGLVAEVRPELHRYCARMTGSIVDGEDVVQDTLAKAFYALGISSEVPPLRPWLFRIAHNAAIDFLKRHDRAKVDLVAEVADLPAAEADTRDPETVRAAFSLFLALPPLQRSAVIFKDVLDTPAAEIARTLGTTVPAVKAALVRGRERLRAERARPDLDLDVARPTPPGALERYVALFNAGDWDGLRALLAEDVELDLVAKSRRKGKAVGLYFTQYAKDPDVRLAAGVLDGRPVLLAYRPRASAEPAYFIEVEWRDDRVAFVRDYRYVPYITGELGLARRGIPGDPGQLQK